MPQTELHHISSDFERLSQRFDDDARHSEKPEHLAVNLEQHAVHAGRLLQAAADAGAFDAEPWWREGKAAIVWGDSGPLSPRSASNSGLFCILWTSAIASWLVKCYPERFRGGAAGWDWSHVATDANGRPLGKDGQPLSGRWYCDGEPLPDNFTPEKDSPRGNYEWRIEGEVAAQTDFYDDSDRLAHLRTRAEVYADACRLLVELISTGIRCDAPQACAEASPVSNAPLPNVPLTPGEREVLRILADLETGNVAPVPFDKAGIDIFKGHTTADLLGEDGRSESHSFPTVPLVVLATLVHDDIDLPAALRVLVKCRLVIEKAETNTLSFRNFTTSDGRIVSFGVAPVDGDCVPAVRIDGELQSFDRDMRIAPSDSTDAEGVRLHRLSGYLLCYTLTPQGLAAARSQDEAERKVTTTNQMVEYTTKDTALPTPPRAQKAAEQYLHTVKAMKDCNSNPTDREVYETLARACQQEGEADELPAFDSWARNLREWRRATGQQKNKPRAGRGKNARSIVSVDDIEPVHLPTSIRPRSAD